MWTRKHFLCLETAISSLSRYHYITTHNSQMPTRKEEVTNLSHQARMESGDTMHAECGCPAGLGPSGSCKHIGALSCALDCI